MECNLKHKDEPSLIETTGIKKYANIIVSHINFSKLVVDTVDR